jgi:hypothetical protein
MEIKGMRKLTVTRIKKFTGSFIPYYCVVNTTLDEFRNYVKLRNSAHIDHDEIINSMHAIANGEEITIEIENSETTLFVFARTSTGRILSELVTIETGSADISYQLVTTYSWIKGSSYQLMRDK